MNKINNIGKTNNLIGNTFSKSIHSTVNATVKNTVNATVKNTVKNTVSNSSKKTGVIYSILILICVVIFVILFIALLVKFSDIFSKSEMKQYKVLMPLKGNAKNMNPCLPGCVRGVCNKTKSKTSKKCLYDFQCQYCQDINTNMFYVNFDNEREIVPLYEEEKALNINQKQKLNDEIAKNNKYINLVNTKIMTMNS